MEGLTIDYSSEIAGHYDFGTTATYQCNKGFALVGKDNVRTCVGDSSSPNGTWNGTAPTCSGIDHFLFCVCKTRYIESTHSVN